MHVHKGGSIPTLHFTILAHISIQEIKSETDFSITISLAAHNVLKQLILNVRLAKPTPGVAFSGKLQVLIDVLLKQQNVTEIQ